MEKPMVSIIYNTPYTPAGCKLESDLLWKFSNDDVVGQGPNGDDLGQGNPDLEGRITEGRAPIAGG